MEFILPIVLGLVLFAITSALVRAPGRNLGAKFVKLGQLKGKTKTEIIAAVGPPNSTSATTGGRTVCQWMATGYHIALLFDGEMCEGVTHEFSALPLKSPSNPAKPFWTGATRDWLALAGLIIVLVAIVVLLSTIK